MKRPIRFILLLLWVAATLFLMTPTGLRSTAQTRAASSTDKVVVPKIWDARQLATWATPVAGINSAANFYSEEEYYAAPIDNLRTYPVYAPDKEPKGYREWMLKQGPQSLIERRSSRLSATGSKPAAQYLPDWTSRLLEPPILA
jgi:hypothetical protein